MSKYDKGIYRSGYFHGGSNINLNLMTCEDNTVITIILQGCVLKWYHTYLLHPRRDRTEENIFQHLNWPIIGKYVWKEVSNCSTCQLPHLRNMW